MDNGETLKELWVLQVHIKVDSSLENCEVDEWRCLSAIDNMYYTEIDALIAFEKIKLGNPLPEKWTSFLPKNFKILGFRVYHVKPVIIRNYDTGSI